MNDILDIILIRFLFIIIVCAVVFAYKFAHIFFYQSSKAHFLDSFYPSQNPAATLFLFSRILGIGLIFSEINIFLEKGIFYASFDFLLTSILTFILYLLALYILESIVLSDFEHSEEITRKNNMCYAIISSSFSIGIAIIFKTFLNQSIVNNAHNIVYILLLWSITIVLLGFSVKSYSFFSKLEFSELLSKRSFALAFSYFGFFFSWVLIIGSALDQEIFNIKNYASGVVLKIILSMLILPLFRNALIFIFRLKEDLERKETEGDPSIGFGLYEGLLILTCAFMTTLITSNLNFF